MGEQEGRSRRVKNSVSVGKVRRASRSNLLGEMAHDNDWREWGEASETGTKGWGKRGEWGEASETETKGWGERRKAAKTETTKARGTVVRPNEWHRRSLPNLKVRIQVL